MRDPSFLLAPMATISELSSLLSDLSTKEDKTSALYSYLEAQGTETREFSVLLPSSNTPRQEQEKSDSLAALVSKHGLQDVLANICSSPELLERITGKAKPKRGSEYPPPIQRLGCANYDIRADRFCPEGGTQTCARCSLVKYCSKNCQVEHWRFHKLGGSASFTIFSSSLTEFQIARTRLIQRPGGLTGS